MNMMRGYMRGGVGNGIISRILRANAEEDDRQRQQSAMVAALRGLPNAQNEAERMGVLADYVSQGGDMDAIRYPLSMMQKAGPDIRSVQGGLYDLNSKGWVLPPKPERAPAPTYSHLRSVNGGLYNLATGAWEVPPQENGGKEYRPPVDFGEDVNAYIDEQMGVSYDKDGNFTGEGDPLDPEYASQIREAAADEYRRSGNAERSMRNAYRNVLGDAPEFEPARDTGMEKDGSGVLWDDNYQYQRPRKASSTSITRDGSGRSVPRQAIEYLKQNPGEAANFEAKYGVSAKDYLK